MDLILGLEIWPSTSFSFWVHFPLLRKWEQVPPTHSPQRVVMKMGPEKVKGLWKLREGCAGGHVALADLQRRCRTQPACKTRWGLSPGACAAHTLLGMTVDWPSAVDRRIRHPDFTSSGYTPDPPLECRFHCYQKVFLIRWLSHGPLIGASPMTSHNHYPR